jgi:hypothetical protein
MRKKDLDVARRSSALVLVDESNVGSSVRAAGRGLDLPRLREFLGGAGCGRDLIEMVVYPGYHPRSRFGRMSGIKRTRSSTGCDPMAFWW